MEAGYKESYKWDTYEGSDELEKLLQEAAEEDEKNKEKQVERAFQKIE